MFKTKRMRWAGHVTHIEEKRNALRILARKSEGKRPLRRPRLGGRIILKWDGNDWIDLAQDRNL
jgi:hypothetical protein